MDGNGGGTFAGRCSESDKGTDPVRIIGGKRARTNPLSGESEKWEGVSLRCGLTSMVKVAGGEMVVQIFDGGEKSRIAEAVLEKLPDWFGLAESTRQYISESAGMPFWAWRECVKKTRRKSL